MSTMSVAPATNILGALQLANPIELLLQGEAGAAAAVNSTAMPGPNQFFGACNAIASYLGYPLSNYSPSDQDTMCGIIGSFMAGLRGLAQGASLAVPNGNYYNFII
jgi:hypothetical protein